MSALRYMLIFALVLIPAHPFATTFPVTKTDDTNDGVCDADCSLREAIDAANANPGADDVPVPAGTYLLTLGRLTILDDVSVAGAGQMNTIVDGNASDRVFDIEAIAGAVELVGVAIQNGNSDSQGGGIRNYADLSLSDSTVSANTAYTDGGGIYSGPYADLTITNSTIIDNEALNDGGGVKDDHYGHLTLTDSTVSGNIARWSGGGIHGDSFSITNSAVSDNSAYSGGGIAGNNFSLTNGTVSGNSATRSGGGILGSRLSLTNTTVSGNTALLTGGVSAFNATLTNSTVSGNTSTHPYGFAGGIYAYFWKMDNTLVADNGVANCSLNSFIGISSLGYNLADDDTCELTDPTDLVVADAMLGPLQDNGGPTETHDLLPASPAIDAGSSSCPPPDTDQRGVARPQGSYCDIGAVEYVPEPGSAVTLIAGAAFLGLALRRRARVLGLA